MDNQNQPLDADLPGAGQPSGALQITPQIQDYWNETRKWAFGFSILGFLYLGFITMIWLFIMAKGGVFASLPFIVIFGALLLAPSWFLFQFAQNLKKGLLEESTDDAATGFRNLRRMYQFLGILTAIVLGFYALMFLLGLLMFVGRSL